MDDPLLGNILLQIILIALNAFFAMTEIAVITVSEAKAIKLQQEGRKGAGALLKLLRMPSRFLATIQVGVTLSGFLGSAFAADNFAGIIADALLNAGLTMRRETLHTLTVVLLTLVISFLTLVFGELAPKRIAMQRPEAISLKVARIIGFCAAVLRPVVSLLTVSCNGVLRLFGIDPNAANDKVTEDEIRLMVGLGGEAGAIESGEMEMIENVFELNDTSAAEVMTHRIDVLAISLKDAHEEIIHMFDTSGLSRFPVYEDDIDNIVGVLRARDYFLNHLKPVPLPLKELLMRPYFVPETMHTDALLNEMRRRKAHMAVVVDEYGGTSGIVTMEDLLEEIVGNIYDESDPAEEEVVTLDDGAFSVPGTLDLDALGELFDMEIQDDEVDTLGGLVFKALGAIPEDGDTPETSIAGLDIQVLEVADRRIVRACVRKSTVREETNAQMD